MYENGGDEGSLPLLNGYLASAVSFIEHGLYAWDDKGVAVADAGVACGWGTVLRGRCLLTSGFQADGVVSSEGSDD
ncbi:TPA: hypothetical protein ACH3X1_012031 [Trebouxia sp. C0004]